MKAQLRKVAVVMCVVGVLLAMFAVPALAAHTGDPSTINDVKHSVTDEAKPYFSALIGIVVTLFGLALLVVLARKAAGMARGAIRKG